MREEMCETESKELLVKHVVNGSTNIAMPALSIKLGSFISGVKEFGNNIWPCSSIGLAYFTQLESEIVKANTVHKRLRTYIGCATASAALFVTIPQSGNGATVKADTLKKIKSQKIELPVMLQKLLEA